MGNKRVCVIGAGVIGLSTAVRIQNTSPNVDVTIIADKFSPDTTSDGAAGMWRPHLLNNDQADSLKKWGDETFDYLHDLSRFPLAGKLGVQLVSGYDFTDFSQNEAWTEKVFGFRELSNEEIKTFPGARFRDKGGRVMKRRIQQLSELYPDYDIVVNCTGLGSYQLLGDHELNPVRGQVFKVKAPWLKHFIIGPDPDRKESEFYVYIIPGCEVVTLDGTAQSGNWNLNVDGQDREKIWKACLQIAPSLKDSTILQEWVGLRPQRSLVRLEMEKRISSEGQQKMVIHNYGHSGAGVTLHWGCANNAARFVQDAVKLLDCKSKI